MRLGEQARPEHATETYLKRSLIIMTMRQPHHHVSSPWIVLKAALSALILCLDWEVWRYTGHFWLNVAVAHPEIWTLPRSNSFVQQMLSSLVFNIVVLWSKNAIWYMSC